LPHHKQAHFYNKIICAVADFSDCSFLPKKFE
jgi:hypothetical protein